MNIVHIGNTFGESHWGHNTFSIVRKLPRDIFGVSSSHYTLPSSYQGGELLEDYDGDSQVFNLFNRVIITMKKMTGFTIIIARAPSTRRTLRGTRKTLRMRKPALHGAGTCSSAIPADTIFFAFGLFLIITSSSISSEEALAACEGAVDNIALDGATR